MNECGINPADFQQVAEALVTLMSWSSIGCLVLGYWMADPFVLLRLYVGARRLLRRKKEADPAEVAAGEARARAALACSAHTTKGKCHADVRNL